MCHCADLLAHYVKGSSYCTAQLTTLKTTENIGFVPRPHSFQPHYFSFQTSASDNEV